MTSNKIIEKSEVREYFNCTGFERWNKIYSKSDVINTVQKNISSYFEDNCQVQ